MAADAPPPLLSHLLKLKLLNDADRAPFLDAVAHSLCAAQPASELDARFGAPFSRSGGEAASLLLAARALLLRVASSAYAADGLDAELKAAGLEAGAAAWLREQAEAFVLPRADALRRAQAAAVAAREASTLTDFDWQLQYVLSSSKLATVREPLLVLELRTRAAGAAADAPADAAETVELSRDDLARALETLKEGADALHAARKK